MCFLAGISWICGHFNVGWLRCPASLQNNNLPIGLECKATSPGDIDDYHSLPHPSDTNFRLKLCSKGMIVPAPIDCSPHCCISSMARKVNAVKNARGLEKATAKEAYGHSAKFHFTTCMEAFANGVWRTNTMRSQMGDPIQNTDALLVIDAECLPSGRSSKDFADASQPAYVMYKERIIAGDGVKRPIEPGSVQIYHQIRHYRDSRAYQPIVGGGGDIVPLQFTRGVTPGSLCASGGSAGGAPALGAAGPAPPAVSMRRSESSSSFTDNLPEDPNFWTVRPPASRSSSSKSSSSSLRNVVMPPAIGGVGLPLRISPSPDRDQQLWDQVCDRIARYENLKKCLSPTMQPAWKATSAQLDLVEKTLDEQLKDLDQSLRDFSLRQRRKLYPHDIARSRWLYNTYPLVIQSIENQKPSVNLSVARRDKLVKATTSLRDGLQDLEGKHIDWAKTLPMPEQEKLSNELKQVY